MLQIRDPNLALINALAALGDPEATAEQARLRQHGTPRQRRWILEFQALFPALRLEALRAGLQDGSAVVRFPATMLAEQYSDERLVPELAELLDDRVESVRDQAARAIRLCACRSAELLRPVLERLSSAPPAVLSAARPGAPGLAAHILPFQALRYPNDLPEVMDALLDALDRCDATLAQFIPETLIHCADRGRLVRALRERLSSPNHDARAYALYTMACLVEPSCEPELLAGLASSDPRQVIAAATGLARLGVSRAIPAMREALGSWPVEAAEDEPADLPVF